MRRRTLIAVSLLVVVLLAIAGGAVAFDHARRERIADGVRVGGIDVGGLRPAAARARIESRLAPRLSAPVVVRASGRELHLSARESRVAVDVAGTVDAAVAASRGGSFIARTWRELTGGSVDATIPVEVTYSRDAVRRLVARTRRAVDLLPKDATLDFSGSGITPRAGHDGRRLDGPALARRVEALLARAATGGSRTIDAPIRTVKAKVTLADLPRAYPSVITVDRASFRLHLFKDLKEVRTYRIAVGQVGLETPAGLYHIQNKVIDPSWHVPHSPWAGKLAGKVIPPGPKNPIKARWMGLYNGAGIHGTDALSSLGSAASHGCVRMAIPDVEDLFDQVSVGTPVFIA